MTEIEWIAETYGLVKSAKYALIEAKSLMLCLSGLGKRIVIENVNINESLSSLESEVERVASLLCLGMLSLRRGEQ